MIGFVAMVGLVSVALRLMIRCVIELIGPNALDWIDWISWIDWIEWVHLIGMVGLVWIALD